MFLVLGLFPRILLLRKHHSIAAPSLKLRMCKKKTNNMFLQANFAFVPLVPAGRPSPLRSCLGRPGGLEKRWLLASAAFARGGLLCKPWWYDKI